MLILITDIDGTLTGDPVGLDSLKKYLQAMRQDLFLVYATGRNMDDYREIESMENLLQPDALILNTGADIFYWDKGVFVHDELWNEKINTKCWNSEKILQVLERVKEITPQKNIQKFKVSFYIEEGREEKVKKNVYKTLKENKINANVIISHGIYLDVLPPDCDKGKASLFMVHRKNIRKQDVIVAGDSENDLDLFFAFDKGIVVANACEKVKIKLRQKNIYFARNNCARGLLEGLEFYLEKKEVLK